MTPVSVTGARPWIRRLAMAACVVLLPAALWNAWDYIEARRLARLVRAIEAQGEPVTALMRYPDPGGNDAARYYGAAAALVVTDGLDGAAGLLARLDRGEPPAELAPAIEGVLARNADAESMLARATAEVFDGDRAGFEYNYRVDRLHWLGVLAGLRGLERGLAGDGDGAAESVVQLARLVRPIAWSSTAGFTQLLTGFGGYWAAQAAGHVPMALASQPSAASLERVQRELAHLDVDTAIEDGLLAERARQLQTYWDSVHDWYAVLPRTYDGPPPAVFLATRPLVIHRLHQQLQEMDLLLAAARRPWPDRLLADAPDDQQIAAVRRRPLSVFGRPYWIDTVRYRARARAELAADTLSLVRAAEAMVAIEGFRRDHAGALPAVLADLVPSRLPSVPVDPYSGRPLIYRRTGDAYAVYGAGRNGVDDGGEDLWDGGSRRYGPYASRRPAADIGLAMRQEPPASPAASLPPR